MGKGRQFLLLLWKNWTLQKRAAVRTFFEILIPLLFVTILVLLRAFKVKDEHKPNVTFPAFSISSLPHSVLAGDIHRIAFSPNVSDVDRVMNMVAKQLSLGAKGFKTEEDMVTFLINNEENSRKHFLGGIVFVETPDSDDVVYKIRLSSSKRTKECAGNKKQEFGSDPSAYWNTQFTFPVFEIPGPRSKNATYGGPPCYFEEGFLSLQHAVDSSLIKYKKDITEFNATVDVKRFPFPDYVHDNFILVIQNSLPLLLMLSLFFNALNIVRDIAYEKEQKLKVSSSLAIRNPLIPRVRLFWQKNLKQ